jgi:hypothetical protein
MSKGNSTKWVGILLCTFALAFACPAWAKAKKAEVKPEEVEEVAEIKKVEEIEEVEDVKDVKDVEDVEKVEDVEDVEEVEEIVDVEVDEEKDPWANPIVTDRPDVADSSLTVGKLKFQVETSFEFTQDNESGITTRTYSLPTLFRFGVIDPLEIRAEGSWFVFQTQTGERRQGGFSDIALGLKWHILDARPKGVPSLGVQTMVRIPTGASEVSSGAVEPQFLILADMDLFYNLVLGVNVGVDVPVRDMVGDKYARFLYAAAINYWVHRTNKRAKLFVEASGAVPLKSNKFNLASLNTGGAFLITSKMQVDGFVRIALTNATVDMVGGVGYSYRF